MNEAGNRSHFTPEGWHTLTPRIVVQDAEKLVEFLRQVFAATGNYRPDRPSVIKIGDSMIMVSEAGIRDPAPAFLYVYVGDADATYRRALPIRCKLTRRAVGHALWRSSRYGEGRMG